MKKNGLLLIMTVFLLGLSACGTDGCSGTVVAWGGEPEMFELACRDGKNYGFVITEDTELLWEEDAAERVGSPDDPWDAFSCGLEVTVIAGDAADSADDSVDACVSGWYFAKTITVTGVQEDYFAVAAKPVIYLYPEETTHVTVALDYAGRLTCTYPLLEGQWSVTARPDGSLTDEAGQVYSYLYWEGITDASYDFSRGFCVPGTDTAAFLETALAQLGLTRREANEFIVYWLPLMQNSPWNVISFQAETYTQQAKLTVTPEPDTMLRVFMAWYPAEEYVSLPAQTLTPAERTGFTLVEWGGAQNSPP